MHVAFRACEGSSAHSSAPDEAAVPLPMCVSVDPRWQKRWGFWGLVGEMEADFVGVHVQVPYKQPVSLHIGSSVTIKGKPVQPFINQPRLQVDFHTAQGDVSDIAFRFQVCFGYYVAMNSRENGAWKQEVKSKNMPFEDGKEFELCISVQDNVYQVMVNGQFSYTFDHRLPQGSVKMVQVWGDISLTSMGVHN
ncbi:galectin-10 [Saimiri boliviensis]|uniref:galectin-10 n=1 Tax=Saimiri boliviensis TaxID=27679 RepID=UPI003D76AD4B